ncbi:MAG: hypothetical protein EBU01_13180 [Crocinitomicaceae bacterium]|nr:hypothetical protein [Crocinitomicaceae bacterium]NCA22691.1 hypothetical protein [Crocinitomicaceae bacterium]
MKYTFFFLFLIPSWFYGQCDKVFITGKVVDSMRQQNFYNIMIINRTSGRGVFGNTDGNFSVYANANDKIELSIKEYPNYQFIAKPDSNCQCHILAFIDRLPQQIQEVVVRPLKTLEQIKEERNALVLRETRMVTGIEVMQSPITALYQAFSKKEQNKRWIAEQKFKDDQRKVVQELIRLYVAYDIIDMPEEQFDDFIVFLNADPDFLKTASEMELVLFIKDKYEHFKSLR